MRLGLAILLVSAAALAQQDLKFASWHVRLLTPLDPEEWSVDVSSRTGRIVGYQHVIKEEAPGATIPITQAEQLALDESALADLAGEMLQLKTEFLPVAK